MKEYKITFNGKEETWYLSDNGMTHEDAMEFIDKAGKRAPMLYELVKPDDSGKTRLQLLHDAGANDCAWCKDSPFGSSDFSFIVGLSYGDVYERNRYYDYLPLCRD